MPAAQAIVGDRARTQVVLEIGWIAGVAKRPAGRDGIPIPEETIAADGVVAGVGDEDHLLAAIVEAQGRVVAPVRHNHERCRCAVGPGDGRAIPLPDCGAEGIHRQGASRGWVGIVERGSFAAEEQQLGPARIADHGVSVARLGTRFGRELAPFAGAGVPFPGVAQDHIGVASDRRAAGAAVYNERLAGRVVGHRRVRAGGRAQVVFDFGPRAAIPLPQLVQQPVAVVHPSEHVGLAGNRTEGHCGIEACGWPCVRWQRRAISECCRRWIELPDLAVQ